MKKSFYLIIYSILFFSCSNIEEELITTKSFDDDIEVVYLNVDNEVESTQLRSGELSTKSVATLKFKDKATFDRVVESEVKAMEGISKFTDFKSLYAIFDEAMDYADKKLDKSEESYYEWKRLYGDYLYFPEYKEDYGAYLPVSDEKLAKVTNERGLVIIGDRIENLKDITNYADLQVKGNDAYYRYDDISTRSYEAYKLVSLGEVIDSYSSDWVTRNDGDRKWYISIERKLERRPYLSKEDRNKILTLGYYGIYVHYDFHFRKKTIFGWSNYKSYSKMSATTHFVDFYQVADGYYEFDEKSPHAFETSYIGGHNYQGTGYKTGVSYLVQLYGLPRTICNFENEFRGSGELRIKYQITFPARTICVKHIAV